MAMNRDLVKPKNDCSRDGELPYINLLDLHENPKTAVPEPLEIQPQKRISSCFCASDTHAGNTTFLGVSDCIEYHMNIPNPHSHAVFGFFSRIKERFNSDRERFPSSFTRGRGCWYI